MNNHTTQLTGRMKRPFSLEPAMKFVTQEQTNRIDISQTSFVGKLGASYADLKRVFGNPDQIDNDKSKVMWCIRFEDGEVATIYDWKQDKPAKDVMSWHIGGKSSVVIDRITSAVLSVGKEDDSEEGSDDESEVERLFNEIRNRSGDVLDSIASIKGEGYRDMVVMCIYARKLTELNAIQLSGLETGQKIPSAAISAMGDVTAELVSRMLGVFARQVGATSEGAIKDAVDWADRIANDEHTLAARGMKAMFRKGG